MTLRAEAGHPPEDGPETAAGRPHRDGEPVGALRDRTAGDQAQAAKESGGRSRDEAEPRPGVGSDPEQSESVAERELEQAFLRSIDEGRRRLSRRPWPLLATGLLGGIDVGTGVLALLVVEHATGSVLLGGLAFTVGFVALTLAKSELFTEDFLVPVTTVIARQARARMLGRLWVGTLLANLAGGWVFTYLLVQGFPDLAATAVEAAQHYIDLGLGGQAFSLGLLGGAVITLMTWMQHNTESNGVKLVPAVTGGFLLAGAQLNHAIVNSLLIFAALHTGQAPFGYLDWLGTASVAAAGNLVGGLLLVTMLRVLQVPHTVKRERDQPAVGVAVGDDRRVDGDGGRLP